MMKRNITIIAVVLVVLLCVGAGVAYHIYSNRFIYNEDGALGNTTGNLYNGGKFCVYNGRVYFSNPNDKGAIYSMKEDGSDIEKHNYDRSSYINISNGYIYYVKGNIAESYLSVEISNGVSRLKVGDNFRTTPIRTDLSDSLLMCGNELYYRGYGTDGDYFVYKANTDGKTTEKLLFEESYQMLDYSDGKIYFANTNENHNLMYYDIENKTYYECVAGNFYMPDCEGQYIYYIDLDNNRALTRMTLMDREPEVLTEDSVITYNYNPSTGEIYYQAENSGSEHMLCKINSDGSGRKVIKSGNYKNINFTKKYVYFYTVSEDEVIYRMPLDGSSEPEVFSPGVIKD